MNTHLAFVKPHIRLQLEAGTKTCEVRLSKRPHPARHTKVGDQLLFKETGGEVFMIVTVTEVQVFAHLFPADVMALAKQFAPVIGTSDYWESKWSCPHGVFLELEDLRPASLPAQDTPRGVMLGWVQNFRNISGLSFNASVDTPRRLF